MLPRTDDSVEAHVEDTLAAGGGLCDPTAVRSIVADGYAAVAELVEFGAHFDESAPGQWALTREGGHRGGGSSTPAVMQPAPRCSALLTTLRPPWTSGATTWHWRSCRTGRW